MSAVGDGAMIYRDLHRVIEQAAGVALHAKTQCPSRVRISASKPHGDLTSLLYLQVTARTALPLFFLKLSLLTEPRAPPSCVQTGCPTPVQNISPPRYRNAGRNARPRSPRKLAPTARIAASECRAVGSSSKSSRAQSPKNLSPRRASPQTHPQPAL